MNPFLLLSFFTFFLVQTNLLAQETPEARLHPCRAEIEQHCQAESSQKDLREIAQCLLKNEDKLSVECKQELQRFTQASRQTTPQGGPMGAIGGLAGMGAQVPSLSYEGSHITPAESGTNGPVVNENTLSISMPVYKTEKETVALVLSGGTLHFGDELTLDSGTRVPNDFYKAEAGLQYSRRLEEKGRAFGLRGSVGYAGDKINDRTQSFNFIANYSFPGSDGGQWVTMLYISNNSPFGAYVPVPGFFYIYRTPTFTGLFGLPVLSMQWTPVNPWAFSFSLFGPTVKTEAAYGAIDQTQWFTGLGFKQQKYLLSNRVEENDRYTIEEKNAEVGFRRPLYYNVFSEFKGGYVFDRSTFIGQGLTDKDGGNMALDQSYYLKWSMKVMF